MTETKKCSVCGELKLATTEYFYKRNNSLQGKCKICYNKYQAERQSTPEAKQKRHARLSSQREQINARQRNYWKLNADKLRKYHSEYDKSRPEKALARVHRRRARLLGNGTEKYTVIDVLEKWGTACHLCGIQVDLNAPRKVGKSGWEMGLHLDHVIKLSDGGPDKLDNVKPSHGICNLRK